MSVFSADLHIALADAARLAKAMSPKPTDDRILFEAAGIAVIDFGHGFPDFRAVSQAMRVSELIASISEGLGASRHD